MMAGMRLCVQGFLFVVSRAEWAVTCVSRYVDACAFMYVYIGVHICACRCAIVKHMHVSVHALPKNHLTYLLFMCMRELFTDSHSLMQVCVRVYIYV